MPTRKASPCILIAVEVGDSESVAVPVSVARACRTCPGVHVSFEASQENFTLSLCHRRCTRNAWVGVNVAVEVEVGVDVVVLDAQRRCARKAITKVAMITIRKVVEVSGVRKRRPAKSLRREPLADRGWR